MAKKRRTKAKKIIAQLRRELEKQQRPEKKIESNPPPTSKAGPALPDSFEAALPRLRRGGGARQLAEHLAAVELKPKIEASARKKLPITNNLYTYDQSLVKKDLLKTFLLSLIFFSLIGIFYWYFQASGEGILHNLLATIRGFFPL